LGIIRALRTSCGNLRKFQVQLGLHEKGLVVSRKIAIFRFTPSCLPLCCLATLIAVICFSFAGVAFSATSAGWLVSVVSDPCDERWNARKAFQLKAMLADGDRVGTGDSDAVQPQTDIKSVTACSQQALAADLQDARGAGYSCYYRLEKQADGTIQLTLENWSGQVNKSFDVLQWSIDPEKITALQHVPQEEGSAPQPPNDYQDAVLESLLHQSKNYLRDQQQNQSSPAAKDTAGGSGHTSSPYTNDGPREKHYLRASLEILTILGVGTAQYYLPKDRFSSDWDFDANVENLKKRFITGEAHRFDNNAWDTNTGHIPVGASYYLLARSNDLNVLESFLGSAAASVTWEALIEMRELVSINDNIMTPFSGLAIGEVAYQFGEFFQHSADNVPNQVLGAMVGLPALFNRWLDNNHPKPPANVDEFGFTTDVWHRFRFFAGGGSLAGDAGTSRSVANVGFELELVNAEKYGKPGEVSTFYHDGVFNELAFRTLLGDGEILDYLFFAKTAFLGHYQQRVEKEEASGQLNGYSVFLGLGSAFEYYSHIFAGPGNEDKFAVCDLLGPSLVADYYHRGLHLRAGLDAYPNFAMVRPFAMNLFEERHSVLGASNIVEDEGYYYALGLTTAGRLEGEYGPFGLEAVVRYHFFDSIDGLNRQPERVVNEFNLQDERLCMKLSLSYALPINHAKIAFDLERLWRWSNIKHSEYNQDETCLLGKVIFEF
jgi:hypothetical protein